MMVAENQYSIGICPPKNLVEKIASYKDMLASEIGWFPSKNSDAHITFNVFKGTSNDYQVWLRYLRMLAAKQKPFQIVLDSYSFFKNGAFFLEPEKNSYQMLENLMIKFKENAPLNSIFNTTPHISIGRKLSEEKIQKALEKLPSEKLVFYCDNLAVRQFDPEKKQYTIVKREYFKDFPTPLPYKPNYRGRV